MNTLYIMQGIPGSGKSTIAKKIAHLSPPEGIFVYSTDDFFEMDGKFDPKKLGEYHKKNLDRSIEALKNGVSVIVDNTNVSAWEPREYVRFAHENNIPVVFIRVTGNFKSIHNVPEATIEAMKARMENLTVESVLASKTPWEK